MLKDVLKNIHGANPITCEAITHVSKYWPYDDVSKDDLSKHCPDIVVCTPALIASFVRGPVLLKPKLFQATRVVILDEVEMFCVVSLASLLMDILNRRICFSMDPIRRTLRNGWMP